MELRTLIKDAEATQARLLIAARSQFSILGYERTTMRGIAAEAGVNVALINRYFGSKEELFAHAVAIDLRLPNLSDMERSTIGMLLVEHFFRRWEGRESDDLLRVLIRTASTNEIAADKIRGILKDQILPMVIEVSGHTNARQRATLIATQILGLAYCRHVLQLGDDYLDPKVAVSTVGTTLQRYLFDPSY